MSSEPKPEETIVLVEGGEDAIGIHLSDTNEHTAMLAKYFSALRDGPIEKNEIYGETLSNLIIQLEFLSRLAGALDFVKRTLEAKMPARDGKMLDNIELSVQILMDVLNEKFGPRPR